MTMNNSIPIEIGSQVIMLLAALMLVMQLLMVVQQMLLINVRLFALQSLMLTAIATVVAYYYNATHIYIVAVLTLVGKVIFLPWLLNRLCAASTSSRKSNRCSARPPRCSSAAG